MGKNIIKSLIFVILLTTFTILGSTYAYFRVSTSGQDNSVRSNSAKYEIIYTGGTHINGEMEVTSSKEGGYNTTVQIGVSQNTTIPIKADIYIDITQISTNMAVEGFVWEAYRLNGTQEIFVKKGNFAGKKVGDKINVVEGFSLSQTLTPFKVYFWIDGNKTDDSIVLNSNFEGYLGAKTYQLTGDVVRN